MAHLIVGNWKMNLGMAGSAEAAAQIARAAAESSGTGVWIAPPVTSIPAVVNAVKGSPVKVGAQNSHWEESGAYTGEISPVWLKEIGCTFAIVGHSERRKIFKEDSPLVAKRAAGVLAHGLTAIICVGETWDEREAGSTMPVLKGQLEPVFDTIKDMNISKIIFAYEPVWAIGTGKVAEVPDVEEAHRMIKERTTEVFGTSLPVLYGGSVTPATWPALAASKLVDGALVGGASLKPDQFAEIIKVSN